MPLRPLFHAGTAAITASAVRWMARGVLPALLTACTAAVPAPVLPPAMAADGPAKTSPGHYVIELQRGACFGRCPQYSLRIADGEVVFSGERYVAVTGTQMGSANPEALAGLLIRLRDPAIARLKDIYRPGQPGCGAVSTDMPSNRIAWTLDGRRHLLDYYQGCEDAPPALRTLPAAIDAAANSAQWLEPADR